MSPDLPLTGKAVVITGAGRGIGESYAHLCAQLGASLLLTDIDAEVLDAVARDLADSPGEIATEVADVSDAEQATRVVDACVERFGKIDGLVNNAALHRREWFVEIEAQSTRRMVEVNVLGVIYCASAAAAHMRAAGSGSIVNVSSGAACGLATQAVYSATKGAVSSLTYALAAEFADSGVRVNAISPLASTRMATDSRAFKLANEPGEADRQLPPPENNAAVVAYLLSDYSVEVNGQVVRVDSTALSLMTHPAIQSSTRHEGTGWAFEDVREIFEKSLTEQQLPLGIVAV